MADQALRISSVKLGLAVAWPAFWTGVPIKFVLVLLLLAMGQHTWELPGLAFFLVLSIPIDIWALGLCARTVFLDRLRVEPPDSLGIMLWWQTALFSAVYLPTAYFIETQTVAVAKAVVGSILGMEILKGLPVPERISIELSLWGSIATLGSLALVLGWLFIFGLMVRKQVSKASPAELPYQALVRRWDLLRVPADQPLALTVFLASGVALVLLLWAFMPVTTPHPHEDYPREPVKMEPPFKPTEALEKTEKLIGQAESAIQALAKSKAKSKVKGKGKEAGKAGGREPAPGKAVPMRMLAIISGALAQMGRLP